MKPALERVLVLASVLLAAVVGLLWGYALGAQDTASIDWGTIPVSYPAESMPVLTELDVAWGC